MQIAWKSSYAKKLWAHQLLQTCPVLRALWRLPFLYLAQQIQTMNQEIELQLRNHRLEIGHRAISTTRKEKVTERWIPYLCCHRWWSHAAGSTRIERPYTIRHGGGSCVLSANPQHSHVRELHGFRIHPVLKTFPGGSYWFENQHCKPFRNHIAYKIRRHWPWHAQQFLLSISNHAYDTKITHGGYEGVSSSFPLPTIPWQLISLRTPVATSLSHRAPSQNWGYQTKFSATASPHTLQQSPSRQSPLEDEFGWQPQKTLSRDLHKACNVQ
jgi:hypothetical protein